MYVLNQRRVLFVMCRLSSATAEFISSTIGQIAEKWYAGWVVGYKDAMKTRKKKKRSRNKGKNTANPSKVMKAINTP